MLQSGHELSDPGLLAAARVLAAQQLRAEALAQAYAGMLHAIRDWTRTLTMA